MKTVFRSRVQEWQKGIKKEIRRIDRDIQALDREEKKHIAECKKMAGRDKKAMMITAKSIVQSRNAKVQYSVVMLRLVILPIGFVLTTCTHI